MALEWSLLTKAGGVVAAYVQPEFDKKLADHQKRVAIKRRDHGKETLAEIGLSYYVSGWTIGRLT